MHAVHLGKAILHGLEILVLGLALWACTARPPEVSHGADYPMPAVRMHHQIAFDNSGDVHVFDGVMIQHGDRFVVHAFAGPGVDLFTVRRDGAHHDEWLHIPRLARQIPIEHVAVDIARTYLPGCPASTNVQTTCQSPYLGEPLEETFDEQQRLVRRQYPAAYGVGLTIEYSEHQFLLGAHRPQLIRLDWGDGTRRMTIRATEFTPLEQDADDIPWMGVNGDKR